ncbi:MAG: hypothetical protein AAGI07_02710 [Bacteroidota bacterium]
MKSMIKMNLFFYFLAFSVLLISCDDEENDDVTPIENGTSVKLAQSNAFGNIITDVEGNTLYFYTRDVEGTSECEGDCITNWPVFYERDLTVGAGLDTNDFGVITRGDGSKQNTYKGWPLYYYVGDNTSGEINGDNVGEVWYVAKPDYAVMVATKQVDNEVNTYLVDDRGNTLYLFTQDETGISNCEEGCLTAWPAFSAEINHVPSLLKTSAFTTITRNDNSTQISYKGSPMYFYAQDNARGEVRGHEVGDVWFVFGNAEIDEQL